VKHRIIAATAALALAASLSGCQSVLKDLQGCERHYNGTVSNAAFQTVLAGQAKIDCCPVGLVANADHTNCIPPPPS
jgi:hypothetical protein